MMPKNRIVNWIAVDWGTSQLRVWLISADHQVQQQLTSDQGVSGLRPDQYETVLTELIDDWLPTNQVTPVLVCGMAGSREGWCEAGYLSAPIKLPQQISVVDVVTSDPRIRVSIVPGIKQTEPANVMRGEETQINGFLCDHADFCGVLVLPGTHTKWVQLNRGELVGFSTAMTGELFTLLSEQSILRYSVGGAGWSQAAFDRFFAIAMQYPEGFAKRLFGLRSKHLLENLSANEASAMLSAELMATEFIAMKDPYLDYDGQDVVIIGNNFLSKLYQHAFEISGYAAMHYSGEESVLMGLCALYDSQLARSTDQQADHQTDHQGQLL